MDAAAQRRDGFLVALLAVSNRHRTQVVARVTGVQRVGVAGRAVQAAVLGRRELGLVDGHRAAFVVGQRVVVVAAEATLVGNGPGLVLREGGRGGQCHRQQQDPGQRNEKRTTAGPG